MVLNELLVSTDSEFESLHLLHKNWGMEVLRPLWKAGITHVVVDCARSAVDDYPQLPTFLGNQMAKLRIISLPFTSLVKKAAGYKKPYRPSLQSYLEPQKHRAL